MRNFTHDIRPICGRCNEMGMIRNVSQTGIRTGAWNTPSFSLSIMAKKVMFFTQAIECHFTNANIALAKKNTVSDNPEIHISYRPMST